MATLCMTDPDDVGAVEVVQVLLEIAFAPEPYGTVVKKAHGALIFFGCRGNHPWRWVGGDVVAEG